MTSTIKVNNIQNQCGANIINENSNTITIGASGDTVALASGASQSGFGRSGSVDWQTTPKTATFTAVSGEGYFINQSSAITMNLPAGSAGAIVAVSDYARNFATYNLTISPNGSEKIGGLANDATLNVNGQAATFVYVDSTKGWINVQNAEDTETAISPFIVATGGTITESGDYRIHTFTGPGTFTVCQAAGNCGPTRNNISYLVIGGGGSGGESNVAGGGGGAGGFREYRAPLSGCYSVSPLNGNPGGTSITVTAQDYPVTVGGGGAGGSTPGNANGNKGSDSVFSTVTSTGGGYGGGYNTGGPGGSGGGGGGAQPPQPGGSGNTPSVSPPQGSNGGSGGSNPSTFANTGGGGGATAVGESISGNFPGGGPGGNGGAGATTSITGSPVTRAGGGGGSADNRGGSSTGGDAGPGGGGQGGDPSRATTSGTANTGGGGGGERGNSNPPGYHSPAGSGGSGIVVIRYKYQ